MPPRNNQKKDNNKLKNKKQPKLTENKLYGSLTTKELKKKHSIGRRGGDGQPGRTGFVARGPSKVADCGEGGPSFT